MESTAINEKIFKDSRMKRYINSSWCECHCGYDGDPQDYFFSRMKRCLLCKCRGGNDGDPYWSMQKISNFSLCECPGGNDGNPFNFMKKDGNDQEKWSLSA